MNKRIVTGLIILMGISILGIVIIQLVWMNNAIRLRNELFDRSVNEALAQTSRRLETMEDFRIINHFAFGDSVQWHELPPIPPPVPQRIKFFPKGKPGDIKRMLTGKGRQITQITVRSDGKKKSGKFWFDSDSDSLQNIQINNTHFAFVNTDSLAHRLDSIYTHSLGQFDSLMEISSTFEFEAPDVRRRIEMKSHNLKKIASKVVTELKAQERKPIPPERIQAILQHELSNRDIPVAFEFGVVSDSVQSSRSAEADSLLLATSPYQVNLFPNDIFQKDIRLSVYFPGKEMFIYRTVSWLLLASLLFSVIMLVTFALSIYFILRQKKISEMKSDFINNMTHEFKTPIATISVAADSIANPKVIGNPERIRYFSEMIKKENTRMNRQVEDILTIARLDKKEFEFKWEAVNLHDLINDVIESIALQVEKKGGRIETGFDAQNPVVTSDRIHCANVVYNLIDNANKYSADAPEIKILTRNTHRGILFSVEDNGIGMSKAVQSRIFERFYRQTSGNIHNVKGFGLGLSYVKAVVEANHGQITVHSEPGKGSRFTVFIPFIRE